MTTDAAPQHPKALILRLNLALALVEGLLVFWSFLREPSESQSAVFLGFSPLRLVLLFVVLLIWLLLLLLFVRTFSRSWPDQKAGGLIWKAMDQGTTFWALLLWVALMYIPLFLSEGQLGFLASYRERLLPILVWSAVLSIQLLVSFVYLRSRGQEVFQNHRDVLVPSFAALILLGLFIAFAAVTRIGLTPDPIYWQEAGVPILLTQVLLAWTAGLIFYSLINRLDLARSIRLDLLISVGLWGLACLLWLSQPLRPAYNALEPSAPNFQIYPFGDALLYDTTAYEYLIGKPIPSDFSVKPLYSLFLAGLHLFSGEDYTLLISLQIILLAIIPVFVYFLTRSLGNRPAGLAAAVLVILRERNGIALSNVIQVSHVKLLLSDVFAMGLMVLLLWLLFRWFEKPENRRGTALALGGVLGLLSLARGHPIILAPLVFCIILLVSFVPFRLRLQSALLLTIGVMIPLIPWFWRNYQMSGELAFQDPVSPYAAHITGLYSLTPSIPSPGNYPPRLPGETDLEYYDRLRGQAFEFIVQHPDEVAKFVSAHYVHNSILSYIYLPHSFRIESLRTYAKTEPFWGDWRGTLSPAGWVLVGLNLTVLALGIGSSWRKKNVLALAPIVIGIGYNLSVSVGRFSGWRFIQPSDWITLIYYAIGLMQLSFILQFILVRKPRIEKEQQDQSAVYNGLRRWAPVAGAAFVFLLVGVALTHGHGLFSSRAPSKSTDQLREDFREGANSISAALSEADLAGFLQTDSAVILYGKALYPAFYRADAGAFNYYWPSYQPQPYKRVIFYLLGPQSVGVILPAKSPPSSFPDGAEVIVLGCKAETGVVQALSVLITGDKPVLYNRDPSSEPACSLPESK